MVSLFLILTIGLIMSYFIFNILNKIKKERQKNFYGHKDFLFEHIFNIVSVFVVGLFFIFMVIDITVKSFPEKIEKYKLKTNTLYSLNNSINNNGSFFIGTGYIDEIEYVFAMEKNEDGHYRRVKYSMSKVVFEETEDLKDKAEVFISICSHSIFKIWEAECGLNLIKVPKGTIIKEFSIK